MKSKCVTGCIAAAGGRSSNGEQALIHYYCGTVLDKSYGRRVTRDLERSTVYRYNCNRTFYRWAHIYIHGYRFVPSRTTAPPPTPCELRAYLCRLCLSRMMPHKVKLRENLHSSRYMVDRPKATSVCIQPRIPEVLLVATPASHFPSPVFRFFSVRL
ncbi:unnamed protein product [Ectocarpus sp. 8 AP-2014]